MNITQMKLTFVVGQCTFVCDKEKKNSQYATKDYNARFLYKTSLTRTLTLIVPQSLMRWRV